LAELNRFLLTWGLVGLSAAANSYGAFIIKLNLNRQGPVPVGSPIRAALYFLRLLRSPLVVSGVAAFTLAPFLFSIALSRMDLSVAQPAFVGLNFGVLVVLACLVLKERLTARKVTGIAAIVIALVLIRVG